MPANNFFGGQFFGGGFFGPPPARGTAAWLLEIPKQRTEEDIRRSRERFGIPDDAARVITEVAARQVARIEMDAEKRFEELARELTLQRIEWDARYLETLNAERERMIAEEIEALMRKGMAQNEAIILLLLVAAATT